MKKWLCLALLPVSAVAAPATLISPPLYHQVMREHFTPAQLADARRQGLPPISANDFAVDMVDLNGDGTAEAIVTFGGQYGDRGYWCGNRGCDTWIYQASGNSFRQIISEGIRGISPDFISAGTAEGYRLLIERAGTVANPYYSVIVFNPKTGLYERAPGL